MKYYTKVKREGWFYPMYEMIIDGKSHWQSPHKLGDKRIAQLKAGAKPIPFKWDGRRWFN